MELELRTHVPVGSLGFLYPGLMLFVCTAPQPEGPTSVAVQPTSFKKYFCRGSLQAQSKRCGDRNVHCDGAAQAGSIRSVSVSLLRFKHSSAAWARLALRFKQDGRGGLSEAAEVSEARVDDDTGSKCWLIHRSVQINVVLPVQISTFSKQAHPSLAGPNCGHHSVCFLSGGPLPGCGLPVGIIPFFFLSGGPLPGCGLTVGFVLSFLPKPLAETLNPKSGSNLPIPKRAGSKRWLKHRSVQINVCVTSADFAFGR